MAHIEEMRQRAALLLTKKVMILSVPERFLSEYLSENLSVRLTRRTLVFWQEWTECVSAFYYFILKAEVVRFGNIEPPVKPKQ